MNSIGGTLVIGVSDEGRIMGLDADYATLGSRKDSDGWEQALRNVLNTYLSKEVAALVGCTFSQAEDMTVAVLRADPTHRPIYLTDGNVAEFHVRSGNTTQQLDVKQANEYIKQRFALVA
jgi:predicted HTH transcriptional regulator